MFDPGPCVYMEKVAGSRQIADLLDLDRPLGETLALVAKRKQVEIGDVMVVMLDRPRHEQAVRAVHAAGARVRSTISPKYVSGGGATRPMVVHDGS